VLPEDKNDRPIENTPFERHGHKYMVDLKMANCILLTSAGLIDIAISDECTYCRSDKYWSHRKTGGRRGSQAAVIKVSL
jgi:hypothetical protein